MELKHDLVVPGEMISRYIREINYDLLDRVEPDISLQYLSENMIKVSLDFNLNEEIIQDDWQLHVIPAFKPDFHWAPHLTPTNEHIIDQHSFRSPALIVGDKSKVLILVPDIDILLQGTPVRWYLDNNARENKLILGMSNYSVKEHVLYVREPGAVYPARKTRIGFYLIMLEDEEAVFDPWRIVLEFLWNNWGKKIYTNKKGQSIPLERYVERTYEWAFKNWAESVWQEFELDGKKVGAPVFIVNVTQSPNYDGPVDEREFRSVWNQAWFSSLRSASGLYRYARRTGNRELLEKSILAKELALSAPQKEGLFPSVIATEMERVDVSGRMVNRSKGWDHYFWGNSNRNPFAWDAKLSPYHILDMSWTALLMLRWYTELETDPRLLDYALRYSEALLKLQDEKGYFPAWLDTRTLQPMGILDQSPETSMSVTFLLKIYEVTGRDVYLKSALKAMDVICDEIIPEGRWEDFETYWSCSRYGSDTLVCKKVERNNMYKQCNLSMFWTAEALYYSYKATGNKKYLKHGQRCLDELLMTQASWQPPYMPVDVFGGFGVMNCDGEWNDARQSLFAELIMQYGLELKMDEYVERGLSALHASFKMMYCPENEKAKVQWERKWQFFNEKDYGFMMENYGHGGVVDTNGEGIGEFTIYDWGNGAAAESFLRISDHYGKEIMQDNGMPGANQG